MRKTSHLFLTVLALLAAALWAGTADAGIPGSAHDTGAGAAGACSACHIPHGGGANRLWLPSAGTRAYVGVVAPLCATCHSTTGGYAGSMGNAASDGFVYHASSHGQLMSVTNLPWRTDVANSGLPYAATATTFECTTCHDVHNDPAATTPAGNRPFLRDTLNEICAHCHYQRHFVLGTASQGATITPGNWGSGFVGSTNPGSHPVGADITGDVFGGASNIVIAVQMRVLASAGAGGWSMGGHLTANTSGGVTCVSCHSVHGNQIDGQDNTASQVTFTEAAPNTNFLALPQNAVSAAWTAGRTVANGAGGFNALCEGCHGGGSDPAGYAGTYNPNPGGVGTFSHPIDDYPSTYQAVLNGTAFPGGAALWPVGGGMTAGANVNPIPICESCHAPHVNAARTASTPRTDVTADAGAYILRDDIANLCSNCHTGTVAGHHPVGMAYTAGGVTYLRNTSGGGTQTLVCGTCHNGAGGAHNWTAAGAIGLDNAWVPSNNGRSATQATDMYNAGMSKTCMDCHYAMDGNAASVSPTLGTSATAAVGIEAGFQTLNTSMGTHYVGLMHTASTTWRNAPLVADIQSTTAVWSTALGTSLAAPGWARFGGDAANPVLVCESCHELEPGKNVGAGANQHLLLARYGDGNNGNDGTGDTATGRDVLCEACHGVPTGTHPLTGQNVGTGSAHVLNSTVPWLRSPLLGYATLGTNALSCDGCHQPHDANTASYTFILDAPAIVAYPTGPQIAVGAGTLETNNPAATTAYPTATGAAGTYATPTLQGKGGSYTGFCDQCHLYAY